LPLDPTWDFRPLDPCTRTDKALYYPPFGMPLDFLYNLKCDLDINDYKNKENVNRKSQE